MSPLWAVLAAVAAQRLVELAFAVRNRRYLLARGGVEHDAGVYPLFVLLHAGWLASLGFGVPPWRAPHWGWLAVYAALQPIRIWTIATLGRRWTTRLIEMPGWPLVRTGPYRWLRHPNYGVAAAEIAILPLAFGAVRTAILFSVLNLVLLLRRIRIEDRVLAPNRRRRSPVAAAGAAGAETPAAAPKRQSPASSA